MGLFNRNQEGEPSEKKIVQEEDERLEQERIAALAENIYQDKNIVLAYDANTLILEHKRRHDEFALDGSATLVTYTCEERMMGTREIAIWEKDLKERNAGDHPSYKKVGVISFSKKESDTFFHLYHDLKNHLQGKVLFYTPEKEFDEICFDGTDRIMEFADGRRTYFIEYRDIIGADMNTTSKTISTNKEHVGKTMLVSGAKGGVAGAEGINDSQSTTTIESYDLVIYLNDTQFVMLKKHYEAKAGDEVQKMFRIICDIVAENESGVDVVPTGIDTSFVPNQAIETNAASTFTSPTPQAFEMPSFLTGGTGTAEGNPAGTGQTPDFTSPIGADGQNTFGSEPGTAQTTDFTSPVGTGEPGTGFADGSAPQDAAPGSLVFDTAAPADTGATADAALAEESLPEDTQI